MRGRSSQAAALPQPQPVKAGFLDRLGHDARLGMPSWSTALMDRASKALLVWIFAGCMKSSSDTPCGIGRAFAIRLGTSHSSITAALGISCRMSSMASMDLPLPPPRGGALAFRTGQSALEWPVLPQVQHGRCSRGTSGCGHLS